MRHRPAELPLDAARSSPPPAGRPRSAPYAAAQAAARSSAGPLAHRNSTVGAAHNILICSRVHQRVHRTRLDLGRQTWVPPTAVTVVYARPAVRMGTSQRSTAALPDDIGVAGRGCRRCSSRRCDARSTCPSGARSTAGVVDGDDVGLGDGCVVEDWRRPRRRPPRSRPAGSSLPVRADEVAHVGACAHGHRTRPRRNSACTHTTTGSQCRSCSGSHSPPGGSSAARRSPRAVVRRRTARASRACWARSTTTRSPAATPCPAARPTSGRSARGTGRSSGAGRHRRPPPDVDRCVPRGARTQAVSVTLPRSYPPRDIRQIYPMATLRSRRHWLGELPTIFPKLRLKAVSQS